MFSSFLQTEKHIFNIYSSPKVRRQNSDWLYALSYMRLKVKAEIQLLSAILISYCAFFLTESKLNYIFYLGEQNQWSICLLHRGIKKKNAVTFKICRLFYSPPHIGFHFPQKSGGGRSAKTKNTKQTGSLPSLIKLSL